MMTKDLDGYFKRECTLESMAVRIGRMPRFGGRCTVDNWTVLHHSLVVELILGDMLEDRSKRFRSNACTYGLLHDLHEGWFGDIPTPVKTDEIRAMQKQADSVIYQSLGVPLPPPKYRSLVKEADVRSMVAEAELFIYPGWYLCNPALPAPDARDIAEVKCVYESYPNATATQNKNGTAVVEFLRSVRTGIATI